MEECHIGLWSKEEEEEKLRKGGGLNRNPRTAPARQHRGRKCHEEDIRLPCHHGVVDTERSESEKERNSCCVDASIRRNLRF